MRGEGGPHAGVVGAALDRQRALPDLGQHDVDGRAARRCGRPSRAGRGRRPPRPRRPRRRCRPGPRGSPCCPAGPRSAGRAGRGRAGPAGAASRWPPPRRGAGRPAPHRPGRRGRRPARARPPMTSPSGVADGRSLAECTARSARPSSTAACTSFTNTPLPPSSQIGTSSRRSPLVSTTTISTSSAGSALCSNAATWSACQRARAEPRVAMRRRVTSSLVPSRPDRRIARRSALDLEQLSQRGRRGGRRGRCPPRP